MNVEQLTVEQFEALLEKAYTLKQEAEEIGNKKKEKEEELAALNNVIIAEFERLDKTSYRSRSCDVIKVSRPTVTIPKDPAQKEAFFDYLKKKKIFEDLASINHNTLNAFYKAEFEAAVSSGNSDFSIPGLDEPKNYTYLSFRKK